LPNSIFKIFVDDYFHHCHKNTRHSEKPGQNPDHEMHIRKYVTHSIKTGLKVIQKWKLVLAISEISNSGTSYQELELGNSLDSEFDDHHPWLVGVGGIKGASAHA
jgi:hypothetical protein